MNTPKKGKTSIQRWADKIQWGKRVKAICKPCWEIKYCPYGELVEEFPLKTPDDRDYRSCRIFGHDCPVFSLAEPFTETKELRSISRSIPRVTQFKVLRREGRICSECGQAVKDEEIEFDHIIPWSRGGSSDENNVRMLCSACNRKKGAKFEDKHLVGHISEHFLEPIGIEYAYAVMESARIWHTLCSKGIEHPSALDFCKFDGLRKVRPAHEREASAMAALEEFFNSKRPADVKSKVFKGLKYRWGFADRELHKLEEAAKKVNIDIDELLSAELSLLQRIQGWNTCISQRVKDKWLHL
ncbi:HNH endonuclease [Chloroflexota bacterium]